MPYTFHVYNSTNQDVFTCNPFKAIYWYLRFIHECGYSRLMFELLDADYDCVYENCLLSYGQFLW